MNRLRVGQIADGAALVATTPYSFTADTHRVVSVHAVWTSTTAAYTLTLQLSNDGATWEDFITGTAVLNNNGSVMWHVDTKDALYWRVNAIRTTGTLTTIKAYVANLAR